MKKTIHIYLNFVSYLKTLPLIFKILLIILFNLFFICISITMIQMLYFSLFMLDLFFFIAFMRPIFFLFSSYSLTSFFSSCLIDLYNLKLTLHTSLFLLCIILLLITFFHKSLKVRLLSSFTSFGIRLFVTGDVMIAGGGFKIAPHNPSTQITTSLITQDFSFLDTNTPKRVPVRTEENLVKYNKPQFYSSYASKFFHDTYIEPSIPSLYKDINVIKNFKLNHGASFTSLDHLHTSLLDFLSLQSGDFRKDGFFQTVMHHFAPSFPQDISFLAHLSQYNFNREDIILLTGLLDRFDMDIVKTFKRGYGWYDGAITVNNKRLTVDCYSPLSGQPNPDYLEDKLSKNIDLIIMGNMKDDFNSHSTDRVIGVKGNSFKNVPLFRDVNEEIETLIHKKNYQIVIPITSGFTISYEEFIKERNK